MTLTDREGDPAESGERAVLKVIQRRLVSLRHRHIGAQLADRIAILHQGTIIAAGTLTELKQLLPPAKVEYVEKQPTLEEVFLSIVGDNGRNQS